jgi:DNA-binding beta-propeller fold protein YncE
LESLLVTHCAQHLLCVFDLHKRAHAATIDLRPFIAPHTLKLGPDGLIYITCENSAVVAVIDPATNRVVDAIAMHGLG